MAVDFRAYGGFGRKGLGNGARREIDDAAHVLRAVAYRAGSAHHVDGFQVAQRHGGQRQLRLAVRCIRDGDAVLQYIGAWRKARCQAAHAQVQRNIATARAIAVLNLHAGYQAQRFAQRGGSAFLNALALNNGAGTRVFQHFFGIGRVAVQPVAGDGDRIQCHFGRGRGLRMNGAGKTAKEGCDSGGCAAQTECAMRGVIWVGHKVLCVHTQWLACSQCVLRGGADYVKSALGYVAFIGRRRY